VFHFTGHAESAASEDEKAAARVSREHDPAKARTLLAKLKRSKTILVVTHQAALLEAVHDEVLVLAQGKIATQGPAMSAFAKRGEAIAVRP